jgi:uncharacterized protein DUF3883
MTFKDKIENLIQSNLKTYRDNSDRFIADYNRELELTKEYNGRQLLELLQNADDAYSNEVYILLDKPNSKLVISNKGESFTVGGIKSLMLANLSTKTKINYIGNKGLGFRSLLNWSRKISIFSKNCKISFSELVAENVFNSKLNLSDSDKTKLRKERKLTKGTVPFPTLGIPFIEESNTNTNWTTQIEINYKQEYEQDIEIQLKEIKEEILLFLNSIQQITIRIDDDETKTTILSSRKVEKQDYTIAEIQNKRWKVFSKEAQLPEEYQDKTKTEKQSFSLKVAFQDDLSDTYYKLLNFFPTQLSISLPCIIHGTFELNSSRNHLNESKKNEYILKELVNLLKECSIYLTTKGIDWRPYKIISPSTKSSDSKLITTFYSELAKLKTTETIYPCIAGKYQPLSEAVYYNDEFDSFFMEHFPETLPGLLIPLNNEFEDVFKDDKYNHDYLVRQIEELSQTDISIKERATLISQLSKVIKFQDEQERISLLVNEAGKVIPKDDIAFTPVIRSDERLNIPKSVKVDFMSSDLYDSLLALHEQEFDRKEQKSRELQRLIKSVVNIQPYDSNNVIDKIITGTKETLDSGTDADDALKNIQKMVLALFANFKNIDNRQDKLKVKVPLVNKRKEICDSESLFLSHSYPSGELTEVIYKGVLRADNYLIDKSFWKLENEESETVESFFLWLGVNRYSKISQMALRDNWKEKDYFDFIFKHSTEDLRDFNIGRISWETKVTKLDNYNQISLLPINNIILLVIKDSVIRRFLEQNEESIRWSYNYWRILSTKYSYIRYQLVKFNLFTKYLLEDGSEEFNKLINDDFHIDYEFLAKYGINKTEVKSILIKLGAKESFNEIEPSDVYEILKSIPEKETKQKGKSTQTIYKLALESLVKQKSKISIPDDLHFFARKAHSERYVSNEEIYYSDNAILPKKILNTLYLLNLPKRIGEDNVEKYFGVKSLREFKIQMDYSSVKENQFNLKFQKHFETIKPYLLAYRLNSPYLKRRILGEDTKRKEAKALKQCIVQLVDECNFSFSEKTNVPIEQKEYINIKEDFYYKDNSIISIDSLKKDSIFCDAFAEMMCIIFKVNDLKNDFRQILKNDLADTIHLAIQDLGNDNIEEAFQLLGVSRIEIDFWKKIFELKGKKLQEPIENIGILKSRIFDSLGFALPENYAKVDFDSFGSDESYILIGNLCKKLSLNVIQYLPQGILFYHQKQIENTIKDNEYIFKKLLWHSLFKAKKSQKNFISLLNKYNLNLFTAIESEIENLKYEIDVDYNYNLRKCVKDKFKVDLNLTDIGNIEIRNRYDDLLIKYNIEDTDIENESIRSLLYFNENDNQIEQYLREFHADESEKKPTVDNDDNIVGTIINAALKKSGKVFSSTNNGSPIGTWVHSKNSDKVKRRNGKVAEQLVYNTFKKEYGTENVKWVSGNSTTPDKNDKLHYDIRYKNKNNEWKYVEVKAVSDDYFIISNSEKEKGLSEPENYEIALVNDKDILLVKDIFMFENGESFENNKKFIAYPRDYIFSYNINKFKE